MTAIQTTIATVAASPVITLKGRGKAQREMAFCSIAPLSFIENISRVESIANLRIALGASPSETELDTAKLQWIIGRVASRLPAAELNGTAGDETGTKQCEYVSDVVLHYAAPAKEGAKARKLRAGQKGRRTAVQHKAIRAAEEAWSLVKAELGLGNAQTLKERNAKKATRSTNANPVRGDGKGDKPAPTPTPTLSDTLPNGGKMATARDVCRVVETAAATLLALANKNAKLLPTDYGQAVMAFKTAINAAANARVEREAKRDAAEAKASK